MKILSLTALKIEINNSNNAVKDTLFGKYSDFTIHIFINGDGADRTNSLLFSSVHNEGKQFNGLKQRRNYNVCHISSWDLLYKFGYKNYGIYSGHIKNWHNQL